MNRYHPERSSTTTAASEEPRRALAVGEPPEPPGSSAAVAAERIVRVRSSMKVVIVTVRRRCLVCEADAVVSELENTEVIGPPCPECHAPTERVEMLAKRIQQAAANPHAAAL